MVSTNWPRPIPVSERLPEIVHLADGESDDVIVFAVERSFPVTRAQRSQWMVGFVSKQQDCTTRWCFEEFGVGPEFDKSERMVCNPLAAISP